MGCVGGRIGGGDEAGVSIVKKLVMPSRSPKNSLSRRDTVTRDL